jgi:hypothetical protein
MVDSPLAGLRQLTCVLAWLDLAPLKPFLAIIAGSRK